MLANIYICLYSPTSFNVKELLGLCIFNCSLITFVKITLLKDASLRFVTTILPY